MSPSTTQEIIQSIIQDAINKEKDARTFYRSAASLSKYPEISTLFKELAEEEAKHIKVLEELPDPATLPESSQSLTGLKISFNLMDRKFHKGMKYQEIMILAIKFEENMLEFYRAWEAVDQNLTRKKLFAYLAAEEAKHKYRLESIYDEKILD
ncbi:MAG: ferritin family protein [Thermodesulfobacteriota bacterium]|jgi:rubrerythrin